MHVQYPAGSGVDKSFLEVLVLHVAVLVGESVKIWIHWDAKGTVAGGAVVGGG